MDDSLEVVRQLINYPNYLPHGVAPRTIADRRYKISVCVPVYNGSLFIHDCIYSILSQSFSDFELIFVNDASTDDSKEIILSFNDPRIQYFENERNLGLIGNWNTCLERSSGDFVCIFHQDDLMSPDNLEKKVALLESEKRAGLVYSDTLVIDPKGLIVSDHWFELLNPNIDCIVPGRAFFDLMFANMNLICCPSVLARREYYEKLGGFDARLPFTGDMEMWMRMAVFYDVAYLAEPLVQYRIHESNETQNYLNLNIIHLYLCKWMLLEKYPEKFEPAYREKLIDATAQKVFDRVVLLKQQQQYLTAEQYLFFLKNLRDRSGEPDRINEYIQKLSNLEDGQLNPSLLNQTPSGRWRITRPLRKLTSFIRGIKNA